MRVVLLVSTLVVAAVFAPRSILAHHGPKGIRLADITWQQATASCDPKQSS